MSRLRAAALLLLAGTASAGSFSSSARGSSVAQFLQLGVGARAISLGGAFSAVADDANALYWNAAGLTGIEGRSASFSHASYIDSTYFDYGAYGQRLGDYGAFGAGFQYFSAGSIPQTDAAGADVGSFNPYDLALSAGYAYRLHGTGLRFLDGLSVGGGGKFIQSKILKTAHAAALDIGLLSPPLLDGRLRTALTASNLGGKLKFDQTEESLPFALRLGSAWRLAPRWSASLDLALPKDDRPYAALGFEYALPVDRAWTVAARAGFNSQTIGSIDGFTGASMGLGIRFRGLAVDYAFLPYGGVGQTHRISLGYSF